MYTIKRFEDRIVAVTGGAKGIGKGCCLRFAKEGARVAVMDLAMDDAAAVATECERLSGQPALALRCNVADTTSVDAAFKTIVDAWGRGRCGRRVGRHLRGAAVGRSAVGAWQKVIDVDLTGVFLTDKAAAAIMMKQHRGGASSTSRRWPARHRGPANAQYSAAKSGVIGLTRSVAMELAPYSITANAVCPGNTMTEMVEGVAKTIAARDGMTSRRVAHAARHRTAR